ncbi:hypothetical protein AI20_04800 [Aeromonas hydrophila YL17]|nr:hypothetical protein AI20_04800 [Aeromonas hydrophila YL17]
MHTKLVIYKISVKKLVACLEYHRANFSIKGLYLKNGAGTMVVERNYSLTLALKEIIFGME